MHNEMEKVHMKPNEIHILNQFLGGGRRTPDGAWDMQGLDHIFNQPHIQELMNDHMYQQDMHKMAHGGSVEHEREEGRHGDTEIAYLPRSVAHRFDQMIGGASRNPHTGHKEYFLPALAMGLARLAPMAIRGIGSLFGGAARAAAPAVKAVAGAAGRGAAAVGRGAAQAGQMAQNVGSRIAANPYAQAAGRGAMAAGRAGMGAARLGYQGLQAAGNVANAALPMSMLYDRFGGGQQQSAQPNNYEDAYNEEFGQNQGGGYGNRGQGQSRGGRGGYGGGYNPNEVMMDLGNPGGNYGNNYGNNSGGYNQQSRGQQYGGNGYGQSYMPQQQQRQPMQQQPQQYGQQYMQQRSAGYLPSQASNGAPQYQGGYAEALNRYGPGGGQTGGPRRPQPIQQQYNPYDNYNYR